MDLYQNEFNNAVLAGLQFVEGFEEISTNDRLLFAVNYARNYLTWKSAQAAAWQSDSAASATDLYQQLMQQSVSKLEDGRILQMLGESPQQLNVVEEYSSSEPKTPKLHKKSSDPLEEIIAELEKTNIKQFENYDYRKDGLRKNYNSGFSKRPLGF